VKLAEARGFFPNFKGSVYDVPGGPRVRNATTTTIAPTGSISILAGCSSGVEPLFAVAFARNILDGERLIEVNPMFERIAAERGLLDDDLMQRVAERGTVRGLAGVPEDVQRMFATAHDILPEWHVRVQAAFQRRTDNAVSKTINFPGSATPEDVQRAYMLAYQMGCKGITIYRDGSQDLQVLTKGATPAEGPDRKAPSQAERAPRERPASTRGTTERITTGCGRKLYVTVNEDERGLCEVFIQMGKSGGCIASQTEAVGRLISLALRSGVRVEAILKHLRGIRCPAPSWQRGTAILSCADAIGQAIERHVNTGVPLAEGALDRPRLKNSFSVADVCPECPECGSILEVVEGCAICRACGYSQCG
jgi:ribonucleoside-diphosphate reductase alpha chain